MILFVPQKYFFIQVDANRRRTTTTKVLLWFCFVIFGQSFYGLQKRPAKQKRVFVLLVFGFSVLTVESRFR